MSVRQEENGTWTAQAWFRDYHGDRRHKTRRGFASRQEAEEWEQEFLKHAASSVSALFSDYYEVYMEDMRPRVRETTLATKEYMIKDKILPFFGEMAVDEITPKDVMRWQNKMMEMRNPKGEPYSQTYLRTVNNQLTAMFNHAVRFYGLPKSPCSAVAKLGSKKGEEMKFWTKDEYKAFAEAVSDKPASYLAFEVLYWCGLRVGEMLALTPRDIDFGKSVIKVRKSYKRLKGKDLVTDPKTPKSVRDVKMPGFLRDELEEYVAWARLRDGDRIFPNTNYWVSNELERGRKAAGVKKIRVHDLRHSHVSMLIEMGFSVVAIAERLGHESTDITLRYAHLFPGKQDQMADALDEMNKGAM